MVATESATAVVNETLNQAMSAYEAAVKAGVKIQEHTAQWWTKALGEFGAVTDFQKMSEAFASQTIPMVQKQLDETLRLMNENAKRSVDLMEKVVAAGQSQSIGEAQEKARQIWESSLDAARKNTEALVQANVKALDAWSQLFKNAPKPVGAKGGN